MCSLGRKRIRYRIWEVFFFRNEIEVCLVYDTDKDDLFLNKKLDRKDCYKQGHYNETLRGTFHSKLSVFQKIILITIGVNIKNNQKLMKRTELTKFLENILKITNKNSFSVTLCSSLKMLKNRKLVATRGKYVNLTKDGRFIAKIAIDEIKSEQGGIDWERIKRYYDRK